MEFVTSQAPMIAEAAKIVPLTTSSRPRPRARSAQ